MELDKVKDILKNIGLEIVEPDMGGPVEKYKPTGKILAAYMIFLGKEGEEEIHLKQYFKHSSQYKKIWCYKIDTTADGKTFILKGVPLVE